ncbi:hypothetical protein GCM10022223_16600 [Kineosporia mesophila]|uniref:Kinase n=1 Tax=Kineosporia mesophila TaxID=566012 RepID=A0ABP6ZBB4_9ACTN|nr:AAA family ATPase [Kineosporia mesophila]MCD5352102.1 hypothetical protein [Kineosporia mesophila]
MRLFLLGAPCAGKTTLMAPLRKALDGPVLDLDEELKQLNGGLWPSSFAAKRVLTRRILRETSRLDDVVLAYSLLDDEDLALLRERDWRLVLLDLPESVMRERAAHREREEGWSNVHWLPSHLDNIAHLRETGAFDDVLDATLPVPEVVSALTALVRSG